jgi:hypothetical protein
MITINVKEVVLTIEEAKELYSQLDDMFGPKMASLPPTPPLEWMTTEEFNLRTKKGDL